MPKAMEIDPYKRKCFRYTSFLVIWACLVQPSHCDSCCPSGLGTVALSVALDNLINKIRLTLKFVCDLDLR